MRALKGRSELFLIAAAGLLVGAAAVSSPVERLAGRHERHFKNGTTSGDVYYSDNVLEIVPLDRRRAYFRARLHFFNGHFCSIWGVAHVEGSDLVYRASTRPFASSRRQCVMRIKAVGNRIDLDDPESSCTQLCGVRGGYAGSEGEFVRSTRRPIRYLRALRNSTEYRQALAEDAERAARHR